MSMRQRHGLDAPECQTALNPKCKKTFPTVCLQAEGKNYLLTNLTTIVLSETENLVTVMWAYEIFDPKKPDTFFEKV